MCQVHSRLFQDWLVTLKFPQGEEASILGLGGPSALWVLGPQGNSITLGNLSTSSPVGPPLGRLPSLLITWEVCHRRDPSSTLPHDLGENGQGRKQLKPEDASKGKCPSLTLFPYPPSVIGIAPDSVHQVL